MPLIRIIQISFIAIISFVSFYRWRFTCRIKLFLYHISFNGYCGLSFRFFLNEALNFCYSTYFFYRTRREKCTQVDHMTTDAILPTVYVCVYQSSNYCNIVRLMWTDFLQVMTQSIHLSQEKIDIGFCHGGTGDDIPEEIRTSIVRLIADHQCTSLHHATLQNRANLKSNTSFV